MEKAILVGVQLPGIKRGDIENSLNELKRLAETAGAKAADVVIQKRIKIDSAYFVGEGKALEIKELVLKNNAAMVIFDDNLKPGQQKNLEELIEAKIIDRTRLILDIFSKRARSKEGIMQVELAQLSYYLPRISKRGSMLDSQAGGIGTRGPGEKKLEVDQRVIRDKINLLEREIDNISDQRKTMRHKRLETGQSVVAVVGYTNAGKSTFLNTISSKGRVYADDKLFATLDPTVRHVKMPGGRIALFVDTVGFIEKLPHSLVAAFRATLEEVTQADCLLHIIDISHPHYEKQIQVVEDVLKELNASQIPIICAYNKEDILSQEQKNKLLSHGAMLISCKTGNGISKLLKKVEEILSPCLYPHSIILKYNQNRYIDKIFKLAAIKKLKYNFNTIKLDFESTAENWEKISALLREKNDISK